MRPFMRARKLEPALASCRRTARARGQDGDLRVHARQDHAQVVGEAGDLGGVVLAVTVDELVCGMVAVLSRCPSQKRCASGKGEGVRAWRRCAAPFRSYRSP